MGKVADILFRGREMGEGGEEELLC